MKNRALGRSVVLSVASLLMIGLSPVASRAVNITVDQIIYASEGGTDSSRLSGTVDMVMGSGGELIITLTNTSQDGASAVSSSNLLTGVGFSLPTQMNILSGSVNVGSSDVLNYSEPQGWNGDVSGEWGFDNSPYQSGGFLNIATVPTDASVSSMGSQTTAVFNPDGSLVNPAVLNGPDFGLVSMNYTGSMGVPAINDSVIITLNLSGSYDQNLLSYIEGGSVVLSFGSPDSVPEAGTLLLLGSGLLGLGIVRRRRK